LESLKKRRAKTIILLSTIWFAIAIPLPFLYNVPEEATPQLFTLIQILGLISIPFVALGIAWTLKPELAQ
jgi:RsiW-degrading membrane proteinase PrsW (M82 family)